MFKEKGGGVGDEFDEFKVKFLVKELEMIMEKDNMKCIQDRLYQIGFYMEKNFNKVREKI